MKNLLYVTIKCCFRFFQPLLGNNPSEIFLCNRCHVMYTHSHMFNMTAAAFFRLSVRPVHFFLLLIAELMSPRKDIPSKDLLNGVSGIQTGQELWKPVISIYKTPKTKDTDVVNKRREVPPNCWLDPKTYPGKCITFV